MVFTSSIRQTSCKKRESNCSPLSEITSIGRPYANIQCVTNVCATVNVVIDRRGTILTSYENLSVMSSRNLFPRSVLRSGPRI